MLRKKEEKIDQMSDNEIVAELKKKALPTFGTKIEKTNRLKKANGS